MLTSFENLFGGLHTVIWVKRLLARCEVMQDQEEEFTSTEKETSNKRHCSGDLTRTAREIVYNGQVVKLT